MCPGCHLNLRGPVRGTSGEPWRRKFALPNPAEMAHMMNPDLVRGTASRYMFFVKRYSMIASIPYKCI